MGRAKCLCNTASKLIDLNSSKPEIFLESRETTQGKPQFTSQQPIKVQLEQIGIATDGRT